MTKGEARLIADSLRSIANDDEVQAATGLTAEGISVLASTFTQP